MNKGLVGIGLIGGIVALVGIFTPWASGSGTSMGVSFSASSSGWNIAQGEITVEAAGVSQTVSDGGETYPYIALAGGVLALVGALGVLASPQTKILAALLAIGGLLAIVGAAWGFADIETGTQTIGTVSGSVSYGYGLYLCLVGGILALLGTLGLRGE